MTMSQMRAAQLAMTALARGAGDPGCLKKVFLTGRRNENQEKWHF